MTKYLTPKVRGRPHPTAGGLGGLIQEYGPPDLCWAVWLPWVSRDPESSSFPKECPCLEGPTRVPRPGQQGGCEGSVWQGRVWGRWEGKRVAEAVLTTECRVF